MGIDRESKLRAVPCSHKILPPAPSRSRRVADPLMIGRLLRGPRDRAVGERRSAIYQRIGDIGNPLFAVLQNKRGRRISTRLIGKTEERYVGLHLAVLEVEQSG
jgi:hypothetical protein